MDTIAAIATPPGRGGIGVLRISGTRVRDIATAIVGDVPPPRLASLRKFAGDTLQIDFGLALYFPAPNSFTGEDILELHGHGGPVVLDLLMARVLQLGARLAQPGEFSQRAFLNDKLDLVQAEAVADLIDSGSEQAARAALRSLQGDFSAHVYMLVDVLIEARMYIEAAIDFPEEEVDFLGDGEISKRLDRLATIITDILTTAQQGALLSEGMTVVIAGKPNAGKSSLLNTLAGYEVAIVTPVPGTTRDVLRERIAIDGMPLHIIDTAGLRETKDLVEVEGIKRAYREMTKADRILYVIDAQAAPTESELAQDLNELPRDVAVTLLYNKVDLTAESARVIQETPPRIYLSAHTSAGIDILHQHLKDVMGLQEVSVTTFSARRRHLDALRRAQTNIASAQQLLVEQRAGELMAEELRQAQQYLGEITGDFTSDDLLGKIFSSFCIGK